MEEIDDDTILLQVCTTLAARPTVIQKLIPWLNENVPGLTIAIDGISVNGSSGNEPYNSGKGSKSGGKDSGGWKSGGNDYGGWKSGGNDSGGDSGGWNSGGNDSGGWKSGGNDSGGWKSGSNDSGGWKNYNQDNSGQQDSGERYTGIVKTVVPGRGYTFITCPEVHALHNMDTFLHDQQTQGLGVESGSKISFTLEVKNGKPQARQVQLIEKAAAPPAQSSPIKISITPQPQKVAPKIVPAKNKRSFDEMESGGEPPGLSGGPSTDFLQTLLGGNADPAALMQAMQMMGAS